jgi:hypothetical protein
VSRAAPPSDSPSDDIETDSIYWFARVIRAVYEKDWPLANVARAKLAALGWEIRQVRRRRRKEATT